MTNLALSAFLILLLAAGFRRPFLWVLAYLYVDILQPQVISWGLLSRLPVSLICFVAAFLGWVLADDKRDSRGSFRQVLMALLLMYCGATTLAAQFPAEAAEKWAWVWKALVFAIFLPFTLRTRLRIEAVILVMALTAGAIVIGGAIKTLAGGGGYGSLRLFVDNNTGLYEGSILSCVAISLIPLIVWLARHGTIFPPDWRVSTFAAALIFACALIPVGTQARTGLVCLAVLCVLYLRTARRRVLIVALMAAAALIALPFLPASYTQRMSTIENAQSDQSASTRLAVWKWTLDYVRAHPFGGGFIVYKANELKFETVTADTAGSTTVIRAQEVQDSGRAFHSSYFEMLGEQGWPGLGLWLAIQLSGLVQMEILRRRWGQRDRVTAGGVESEGVDSEGGKSERHEGKHDNDGWQAPLAAALQLSQVVYLVGSLFVGIAFQPFILMLVGVQCGLWTYLKRSRPNAASRISQRRSPRAGSAAASRSAGGPPTRSGAFTPH